MPFLDRAVGIDLGTTNSEIAWLPPSEREVWIYADRFGRKTVPSAVSWDEKNGAFLVGHAARSRRGGASPPIESIKRRMGQKTAVALGPSSLSPEEVSAKILAELKARMTEQLAASAGATGAAGGKDTPVEHPITRAVITVPAYFDAPQVEATRRAGELAGLDVIGILQEPTAAAIYHTWKRRLADGNFLVYDLGGGTFDVSIVRCVAGEYQVLAIDGDNYLGGDDFDRRFAEHLRRQLVAKGYFLELNHDAEDDRRIFTRLVHLAQEIKESLSTAEVVHVAKSDLGKDKGGETITFDEEVGRADYEVIVGDLVETTLACCERALARSREVANVGAAEIDHVILVGGSTRVPLVVRRVAAAYSRSNGTEGSDGPLRDDVDTCVALGAAIHAAHVGGTTIGDAEARVRIATPLVTQGAKLRLGLTVEHAPKNATNLVIWDGDRALAEGTLGSAALRFDLPLGTADATNATIAFQTSIGASLAELPLTLHRGDLRPRPTSLSRASVIAKDVSLEVIRGGRRDRKVLLGRGTGLPAHATHVFFTADQSGAVVLRILQNRLPIKTLAIDVPKTLPVGSPVEIVIRCDESMRLEASATVGAERIEAQIEAPPNAEETFESSELEALLERTEKAKRALWGSLGAELAREADRLVAGIREVMHVDRDKLAALTHRLRHLVEEIHGGPAEGLVPPMARMEDAFDSLRRVVYRSSEILIGMSRAEWDARIDALHDRSTAAHAAGDGPTWRRVFNEVEALGETAYQEELSRIRLDDPAYVTRRTLSLGLRAQRAEDALAEVVPSATAEVRARQDVERARIQTWLRENVNRPLAALGAVSAAELVAAESRRALGNVGAELDRIEAAIERLPSLGLVTDRGAASG